MAINAGDLNHLLTGMILQVYLLISKAIYTVLISPFRTGRAHVVVPVARLTSPQKNYGTWKMAVKHKPWAKRFLLFVNGKLWGIPLGHLWETISKWCEFDHKETLYETWSKCQERSYEENKTIPPAAIKQWPVHPSYSLYVGDEQLPSCIWRLFHKSWNNDPATLTNQDSMDCYVRVQRCRCPHETVKPFLLRKHM